MVDKIDGVPGSMGKYNTDSNLQDFKPDAPIQSRMDEGRAFTDKDGKAKTDLETFLKATGERLRQATITAKAAKHTYIGADWDAGQQLRDIAFKGVYVSANPKPYV